MSMGVKVLNDQFILGGAIDLTQAAAGVAGILNGAKVGLATAFGNITPQAILADVTQPTGGGLAPVAITWSSTPVRLGDGRLALLGTISAPFRPTAPVTPQVVVGFFVEDSAATKLLWLEQFTGGESWGIADTYSFCDVEILLALSGDNGLDSTEHN